MNGIAAALNYLFGFITKKTYYNLEATLSLPGTALFYCIVCGIGLIFTYAVLPETEGRSLEEIELHFADNSKNLCDRTIEKKAKKSLNCSERGVRVENANLNKICHDNKAFEDDNGQNVQ